MTYDQWVASVPDSIRQDTLWKIEAYRIGLFIGDLAWKDAKSLMKDRRMAAVADQLFRAAANVSSNIAEGYSRGPGKDRGRFYEYAPGSAREARDWYFKARHVLSEKVVEHRMDLLTQIVRLTLSMTAHERRTNRKVIPD